VISEVWELFDPAIAPHDGDMKAYLARVLQRCVPLFNAGGASIFLKGPDGTFKLEAQIGMEPPIPESAEIVPGRGVAGASLELGSPLLVKDVQSENIFRGRAISPRNDLGSAMVVPLIVPDGAAIGVLNLSRSAGQQDFGQEDLKQASSLAYQVALAVGSGQLLAAAEQNRAWLKGLMDCMPAAVFAFSHNGKMAEANSQAKQLLESSPEWLSPDLPLGHIKVSDPETRRTWRIDSQEAGGGRVVVAQDISDEEYEAEQNARVKRLAEIGQMSAAVAHEIRNPLTGIRAAAQMLLQYPDQGPELAQIIDEEVHRLNNLCEDFLEFARPLSLNLRPARLSDIARKIVKLEAVVAAGIGIELTLDGPAVTPEIDIDVDRVHQVIRNLLRNAVQACEPGDRCTIRLHENAFEIEDTGCGMSERTLKNLFVPFYTTKPKGTGLGLSNSRKIVEAHGGRMECHSTKGEGTKFLVELGRVA
jgi:signal transduction histidine kinase